MENIFPELLIDLLMISITFSFILMILIQKFKSLNIINKSWEVWALNLVLSFAIGMPFAMHFYSLDIYNAIWVGLFSFIGAASIYKALKDQTIINYKPNSVDDKITIDKNNEIKRDDV